MGAPFVRQLVGLLPLEITRLATLVGRDQKHGSISYPVLVEADIFADGIVGLLADGDIIFAGLVVGP